MRFESSYLKKIKPFVSVERRGKQTTQREPLDEPLSGDVHESRCRDELPHEIIKVQWTMVIWVTIRDQVMSPFVQGILL